MADLSLNEPQEVTDERIYADLKGYQDFGMIEYVLPTEVTIETKGDQRVAKRRGS